MADDSSRRRSLKFSLSSEEIGRQERQLATRLADQLRYDLKAVLVPLAGGGFNIVLHNRRDRTEVRGLCDPSFIAFNIASYTAGTDWKSENLQIWLRSYEDGWFVPTRGSRVAVERGQASSPLGMFGVVEVRTFRSWLEKAFQPLTSARSPWDESELEGGFELPPVPERIDAGVEKAVVAPAVATTLENSRSVAPAPSGRLSGEQELDLAWKLYGQGQVAQAREALRRARKRGVEAPELEMLLDASR